MAIAKVNGIALSYADSGSGELVVLVMGTGCPGKVWDAYQVPALLEAGYRVVTVDNRGIPPTEAGSGGFTVDDVAADIAALITELAAGPAIVIGTSLGARVAQELALARPDLVSRLVTMAGCGRREPVQDKLTAGEIALHDEGISLPHGYYAAVTALLNLSPATLRDAAAVRDWIDLFEVSGPDSGAGVRAQNRLQLEDLPDRLEAYRAIRVPTLVLAFADDLMVPPQLSREVATAIPGARCETIPAAGHFGYLERPAEVNEAIMRFLARPATGQGAASATEGGHG